MRTLRQLAGWLKRRLAKRAIILMYHRVTELPNDPYLLAVTPKRFAEQMEAVRRHYFPIGLQSLVQALREGRVPERAVVVTFDDGYADNLFNAKPLLERYDVPATIFVTTGHIGQPYEFWWDELDRLLLQPGALPPWLELSLDGCAWQLELGEAATYTSADYQRDRNWHVEREDVPTRRHHLQRLLYQLLHNSTAAQKEQLLEGLRKWAGAEPIGRTTHRVLTRDEVIRLSEGGLIEIGAHTMTHPALATLPLTAQRDEIEGNRVHLEEMLNHPVASFAYPHGSYTPETLAVVREVGFSSACSSDTEVVRPSVDAFRLPRICVRNWDRKTFSGWLRTWLRR